MNPGRLIRNEPLDGALNMGIDSALCSSVVSGESPPVLRFYSWERPTVTMGRFQKIGQCIDYEKCRTDDIQVIRRLSGGGTVYHSSELTWSISVSRNTSPYLHSLGHGMKFLIRPVMNALRDLGLDAQTDSVNDILVNGRKISGSAQFRTGGFILHHGTVMLHDNRDAISRYLKRDHLGLGRKIVSLEEFTPLEPGIILKLTDLIARYFSISLEMDFHESALLERELEKARCISENLFSNDTWIKDGFSRQVVLRHMGLSSL